LGFFLLCSSQVTICVTTWLIELLAIVNFANYLDTANLRLSIVNSVDSYVICK
jgi:hypothetical protein